MMVPSHYIETIIYSNKNLVVDYQIEKVPLKILGRNINLNNWLTFKDWLEVYDKLHTILYEQNKGPSCDNPLINFTRENYLVCNNRIKVEIAKENFVNCFAEIFQVKIKYFHPFVLRIYISLENQNTPPSSCSLQTDKKETVFETAQKPIVTYEPYKPIKNKVENKNVQFIKYTPSQISQEEPYTPQLLSNKDENISPDLFFSQKTLNESEKYPVYKASPISSGENENNCEMIEMQKDKYIQKRRKKRDDPKKFLEQRETRSKKRSGLRPIFENKRKNTATLNKEGSINRLKVSTCKRKDLFGSDDSELDVEIEKKLKQTQKKISNKIKKSHFQKDVIEDRDEKTNAIKMNNANLPSLNTIENLSTGKLEEYEVKGTKVKHHLLNNENIENTTSESLPTSNEEYKSKRARHIRDIQAIKHFNNAIKNVTKLEKNIELKTLNHLSVDNVLNTFPKYKKILDIHFDNFKLRPQRNIPKIENLDYMALQNFIPAKHLLAMCTYLRDIYECGAGVPRFTDLYMHLLIPEWVLAIFMEEYKMDRQEALKQILDQEETNMPTQISTQIIENSLKM